MSERVLVLADAHLRGLGDPVQAEMVDFLAARPAERETLVLLGDFFEYLAGRNQAAIRSYAPVLATFGRFGRLEVVEGNHDFDLRQDIPGLARARIHPVRADLSLAGLRCSLFHGDRSAERDLGTRLLRKALQSRPVRFARDHLLPDAWVFRFALAFANQSRRNIWPGREDEAAETRARALAELRRSGAELVLFAHTHEAHIEPVGGGGIVNPGAARPGGSYLEIEGRRVALREFPGGRPLSQLDIA